VLKILGWQRPGTIGWRQHLKRTSNRMFVFLCLKTGIRLAGGFMCRAYRIQKMKPAVFCGLLLTRLT
jgi:hypothetical protein